jgi:hypothetical protein
MQHTSAAVSANPKATKAMVDECRSWVEGDGGISLQTVLTLLPRKEHVRQTLAAANIPENERTGPVYLAYLFGVLAAVVLRHHAHDNRDTEVASVVDPLEDPQASLSRQTPAVLRTFLWTLASVRVLPGDGPTRGFFARQDSSPDALNARATSLLGAFGVLIGAMQKKGEISRLSKLREYVTLVLLLDQRGSSDRILRWLQELGLCRSASKGRELIRAASARLSLAIVFDGCDADCVPALGFAADNADIRKFGTVHSFIACSAAHLGFDMTAAESDLVQKGLRIGTDAMKSVSQETARAIALDDNDLAALAKVRETYNVLALLQAAEELWRPDPAPPLDTGNHADHLCEGGGVRFTHLGSEHSGTITAVHDDIFTVTIEHADGATQQFTKHGSVLKPPRGSENPEGENDPILLVLVVYIVKLIV